jgi:branched-subunit amino acid transport protein
MTIWLTILAVGILTYGTRLSFIYLFGRRQIPARVKRGLRFVPPAVLTAIIFPELFLPNGTLEISLGNERLLAGLIAALVAWRTGNVVATIIAGMGALLIIQALGG